MLLITIIFFLLLGLYLFGIAVRHLWLMEWYQMNPVPVEAPSEEEEEGPKLTKLGRPITDIKLSA